MDDMVPTKTFKDTLTLAHIMKQWNKIYCCQIDQINPPEVEKLLRSAIKDWTHKVNVVVPVLNQQREDPSFNSFSNE